MLHTACTRTGQLMYVLVHVWWCTVLDVRPCRCVSVESSENRMNISALVREIDITGRFGQVSMTRWHFYVNLLVPEIHSGP